MEAESDRTLFSVDADRRFLVTFGNSGDLWDSGVRAFGLLGEGDLEVGFIPGW